MKTDIRDGLLIATTDDGKVLRMIAQDDIATAGAIELLESGNRFALAVLSSMQNGPPFTAQDFLKRLSEAAGQELLTGRRDPALYGENIASLPSLCQCCFDRLPVSATSTICPTCAAALEV